MMQANPSYGEPLGRGKLFLLEKACPPSGCPPSPLLGNSIMIIVATETEPPHWHYPWPM